jgi:hypothetical protein
LPIHIDVDVVGPPVSRTLAPMQLHGAPIVHPRR